MALPSETDPQEQQRHAMRAGQAPLAGTRAQAMQRLQVGIGGLAAMILLVGLASTLLERAKESDASAVPEAAATVASEDVSSPGSDPLADAGVVPDLPAQPNPSPTATSAIDGGNEDGGTGE